MRYKYNIAYVYMWMYDLLGISELHKGKGESRIEREAFDNIAFLHSIADV